MASGEHVPVGIHCIGHRTSDSSCAFPTCVFQGESVSLSDVHLLKDPGHLLKLAARICSGVLEPVRGVSDDNGEV